MVELYLSMFDTDAVKGQKAKWSKVTVFSEFV